MNRRAAALSILAVGGFSDCWTPDEMIKNCEKCGIKFSLLQLRHHCRFCGRVYCKKCTKIRIDLPQEYGYEGPQRVCETCLPIIQGKFAGSAQRRGPSGRTRGTPREQKKKDNGVDDMVMLSDISDRGVLTNLQKRHANDAVYTYIGNVLVSVNPFKLIPDLYSQPTLESYRGKYAYELPPHIYATAELMYRQLISECESQCVIISGESGAGKTEASKLIMQYIAAISGKGEDVSRVKDIILDSNPLLEAFGNAKTLRNNNSSRFGKYMEIHFDGSGDPRGGKVTNYLLEKSRVVYQTPGERNFHIFYQLLAGAPVDVYEECGIRGSVKPDTFHYLNQSKCYTVDRIDDLSDFNETMNAMKTMKIDASTQRSIIRLVLGILYLGNLTFTENAKEEAKVTNRDVLNIFAKILQVTPEMAEKALCSRTISSGVGNRGTVYTVPQNAALSALSRDALAKALYSRLFDYIVHSINSSMSCAVVHPITIGVLDIYGFEIFERNGFEQFCINYVNEKLQQIFIELTLKAEQDEYKAEGINWEHIDYFNNKICCDLIEAKKPIGIFPLLDDVSNFPKGDDRQFLEKVAASFSGHPHLVASPNHQVFTLKHYAGDVTYDVNGFVEKNRDTLYNDLISLGQSSKCRFIQSLFPDDCGLANKKRPTSAGFKIKSSISELVEALSKCTPHYVRCIKSNNNKQAGEFDQNLVMHQVHYLALLENVRVRRAGYAYRQLYDKFYFRYRVCSSKTWPHWSGNNRDATSAILADCAVEETGYRLGHNKVFIRKPEVVFSLEEIRERKLYDHAVKIQEFFEQYIGSNNYYYQIRVAGNQMVKGKKERRRKSLDRPYRSDYINHRENNTLYAIVERFGDSSIEFSDNCDLLKYDQTFSRRIFLLTNQAFYIVGLRPVLPPINPKVKNPPPVDLESITKWYYAVYRRVSLEEIERITLSKLADNYTIFHVKNQHDCPIVCRRKTELVSLLLKQSNRPLNFQNSIDVRFLQKKKKKHLLLTIRLEFISESGAKEEPRMGALKGVWNVPVSQGESSDSIPVIDHKKAVVQKEKMKPLIPSSSSSTSSSSAPPVSYGGAATTPRGRGAPRGGSSNSSMAPTSSLVSRGGRGMAQAPPVGGRGGPIKRGAPRGGANAAARPQGPRAVALYDFRAENPDELNMRAGDVVTVVQKRQQDDWWQVESAVGKRGLVPSTYLDER